MPRENLTPATNNLTNPMDLRLDMMVKNSALRLYRLLSTNQLFRRIGNGWHNPEPDEPPLPTSTPNQDGTNTTLHLLAAKAPVNVPRIDIFPTLPEGIPSWRGRVEVISKKERRDYQQITRVLVNACRVGTTINVF
jgi:hypothetical protein